ncbi:L,D-transpeptidase family protein [Caulobacter sp. SL161]|uniref:L,D-transpeptidase family protein n=1 Tax=Caulobacter sp. SL161 TaxID=2995156 RepID=UPI002273A7A9|nr:L,D-transpeptidase family protein [Caulobacter sp. SL161]MCY1647523.1 L,D-transpeptidase family protein [Caulobacter sp. SL161]
MMRFPRTSGALAATLSLLSLEVAQAQSQRPPVMGARPVQSGPIVAPRPAVIPPDLSAVQLSVEQVEVLRAVLGDAYSHGFAMTAFSPDRAIELYMAGDPASRAAGQAQLVSLTLAYARAVRTGRLPISAFKTEWGLRPAAYDPAPEFVTAVQQGRLAEWLETLPPPYTGYQTLRTGLATYRDIAAKGGWLPIAAGPELKEGATGARVVALEARLAAEDPTVAVDAAPVFDAALTQAVQRAQKRFGLNPNGIVDRATLAALNIPVERRIDQIVANMERWRWLPQTLPAERIQVNVAAAILSVFHHDTPTLTMRAVTGRPGDETPMLSSMIHSIVLNPPWNVPQSIASKEIWPKERASPGYLARNDFIVIPTEGGGSRLQQKAGPLAALGKVKFDFNNPYGVYLHDTPSRSRFDSFSRLASHGCVRLQKPIELVNEVMRDDPTWTPEKVNETLASGETVRAKLPQQIAVYLLYWTAYVTPDGQVNFRQDPYGWDRELVQRIAAL